MNGHPSPSREHPPANRTPQQARGSEASSASDNEWVTIGQIVALFGVRGDLKVIPQTDIPNRFSQLGKVHLGPEHQPYQITSTRPYKEASLVIHLGGIESANAAEAFIGQSITLPLSQIAPLPPDQYYIHDLIGLRVESTNSQALGVIADILATGGNDVYIVRETGTGREVLVPAVKEIVKQVDIAAGRVIIDPIPGLFDDRFEEAC